MGYEPKYQVVDVPVQMNSGEYSGQQMSSGEYNVQYDQLQRRSGQQLPLSSGSQGMMSGGSLSYSRGQLANSGGSFAYSGGQIVGKQQQQANSGYLPPGPQSRGSGALEYATGAAGGSFSYNAGVQRSVNMPSL